MAEIVEKPKRTGLLIWLIVSQILADANGRLPAWVIPIWCYPIFSLCLSAGAWIAYKRRKNKIAAILSGLSFAPVILFFLIINLS